MDGFDAIVVGAGPAGCAAAISMARSGLSVLVLERAGTAGGKNVSGGVLHGGILGQLVPNFWREAPVERWIVRQDIGFLGEGASLQIRFTRERPSEPVALSVLRSKFDGWLVRKAEEAGATVLKSTLVEDVILRAGKVIGVQVTKEKGEVYGSVVVLADGANSLLAEKAGLRTRSELFYFSLGVKEVLKLPAPEIEKRFQLSGDEGASYSFVGEGTYGLAGGCFIYTNRESISIGAVVNLSGLKKARIQPHALLDHFKEHPAIAPLVAGGSLKEYSAHLIPEGGYDMLPKLCAGGVLVAGDAAGLTINTGLNLRGMDVAIASGIAAAETVKRAKAAADFSARSLAQYGKLLERSFVLSELKRARRLTCLLRADRLYKDYPSWFCRAAQSILTVNGGPRRKAFRSVIAEKPRELSGMRAVADALRMVKDL